MIRKCFTVCVLSVLAMLVLAGCGQKKAVDPYAQVTLHQATYGPPVISKGYKYKIVDPEIVESVNHLCLVREGNIVEFIAGRSIADKIENMDRDHVTFKVVKKYTPYVHFKCEELISGADTVFIAAAGSIDYPMITAGDKFASKQHEEYDIDRFKFNDSAGLNRQVEKKFAVTAKVVRVEEDGKEVWMLQGLKSTLRVEDPTDAQEIILRLLARGGEEFQGGITFNAVEDWLVRKNNQISGTVGIDWVRFAGRVFS